MVGGSAGGPDDRWVAVVADMAPVLRGVARRRLRHATNQDVEDAVAEAVARTCGRPAQHALPAAALERWVVAVLCNVVREHNRRAARAAVAPPWGSGAEDPLDRVIDTEETAFVRTAYAALAFDDREVLRLRVVEGLGSAQAAVALGKRPGAVRMAQARALGRLREQLAPLAG